MTSADLSADRKKYNKVVILFCWPMKKELKSGTFSADKSADCRQG